MNLINFNKLLKIIVNIGTVLVTLFLIIVRLNNGNQEFIDAIFRYKEYILPIVLELFFVLSSLCFMVSNTVVIIKTNMNFVKKIILVVITITQSTYVMFIIFLVVFICKYMAVAVS